jgi:hypothetical protein
MSEAARSDATRGPLNIQRLYSKHEQWMAWDSQTLGLFRQEIDVTKKEVAVAKQMAELPEQQQVQFWRTNFQPLLAEEGQLQQKLAAVVSARPGRT